MAAEPTKLLIPSTQISTGFQCDNCFRAIDSVSWKRCNVCKVFDLCKTCDDLGFDKVLPDVRKHHEKMHQDFPVGKEKKLISSEYMEDVTFTDADEDGKENRDEVMKWVLDLIMNKKIVPNDYHIGYIMGKLQQTEPEPELSSGNQLLSIVSKYYTNGYKTNIRVLSLDGGGVRGYMSIQVLIQLIIENHFDDDSKGENEFTQVQKTITEAKQKLKEAKYKLKEAKKSQEASEEFQEATEQFKEAQEKFKEAKEKFKKAQEKFEIAQEKSEETSTAFQEAQEKFTKKFDYFVGTSAGGLIAFCLAVKYDILKLRKLYKKFSYYFENNLWLSDPIFSDKYKPDRIHREIGDIIRTITLKDGTTLSPEHATLLDIHNFLNDDIINNKDMNKYARSHGNLLEFADDSSSDQIFMKREKVLLITAYNATESKMVVFNSSYSEHWGYRIADVLKATMAAPAYFPPHQIHEIKENGVFKNIALLPQMFLDGGIFANDPELAALWVIRMQWKKPVTYNILSIGTGTHSTSTPSSSRFGGVLRWGVQQLVSTILDATCSLTETVMGNLAQFPNMKRIKFNYRLSKPMGLDDTNFVDIFNTEWEALQDQDDFEALKTFYKKYFSVNKKENDVEK